MRWCGDFHLMADPFRKPHHLPWTLRSKLSSIGDGLQLMRWRSQLSSMSLHEIFSKPEIQTREYLEKAGFSRKFIDAFLRPFFAGVFCLFLKIKNRQNTPAKFYPIFLRISYNWIYFIRRVISELVNCWTNISFFLPLFRTISTSF